MYAWPFGGADLRYDSLVKVKELTPITRIKRKACNERELDGVVWSKDQ